MSSCTARVSKAMEGHAGKMKFKYLIILIPIAPNDPILHTQLMICYTQSE